MDVRDVSDSPWYCVTTRKKGSNVSPCEPHSSWDMFRMQSEKQTNYQDSFVSHTTALNTCPKRFHRLELPLMKTLIRVENYLK